MYFGATLAAPVGLRGIPTAPALPRVTTVTFRNTGTSSPANCCRLCPVTLGVGRTIGAPPRQTASNGMELIFTLTGHRRGIDYDIVRTRRDSLYERRAGVWTRLDSHVMGTNDDHHNSDECLSVVGNRIFVIDTPGFPGATLPQPDGVTWGALTPGIASHADATDVVIRFSFAEWVIARDRAAGIPFRAISPGPFIFWHSITWLTRNAARQWVLDVARSRIERGSLSAAIVNSAPGP